MDYKNDLGVPDWRDGAAYPDATATSDRQWQWEFLRRRPDYRDEWIKTYDDAQAHSDALFGEGLFDESHRQLLRPIGAYKLEYRWRFRIAMAMAAPSLPQPPMHFFFSLPGGYSTWDHRGPRHSDWSGPDDIVKQVAFDLRKPLKAQITRATAYLKRMQKEMAGNVVATRAHPEKWTRYLRVIDARDADATWQAIYIEINEEKPTADLPREEFDRRVDNDGAAKARQVWEQARDLMFKLTR